MIDSFFLEIPKNVFEFTTDLQRGEIFKFNPVKSGATSQGKKIELGFSCYALKIYFMTGEWDKVSNIEKQNWINFINSFQQQSSNFPEGSFVDYSYVDSIINGNYKDNVKDLIKSSLSKLKLKQYESRNQKLAKSINAETKQAISTLNEVGHKSLYKVPFPYENEEFLSEYLEDLNWMNPWSSGAQVSSLCVYSKLNDNTYGQYLYNFLTSLNNQETGSYHHQRLNNSREIINGAMKVISGLDWLDMPIHNPKRLIDFCLRNVPVSEGCDIVDFVYVLYKCSKQVDYKKKEINKLLINILSDLKKLYISKDGSFSYFVNKSQTHYYGAEISKGNNTADLHASVLGLWALLMILDNLELMEEKYKIIKP